MPSIAWSGQQVRISSTSGKRSGVAQAPRASTTLTRKPSTRAIRLSAIAVWVAPTTTSVGVGTRESMNTSRGSPSPHGGAAGAPPPRRGGGWGGGRPRGGAGGAFPGWNPLPEPLDEPLDRPATGQPDVPALLVRDPELEQPRSPVLQHLERRLDD